MIRCVDGSLLRELAAEGRLKEFYFADSAPSSTR